MKPVLNIEDIEYKPKYTITISEDMRCMMIRYLGVAKFVYGKRYENKPALECDKLIEYYKNLKPDEQF